MLWVLGLLCITGGAFALGRWTVLTPELPPESEEMAQAAERALREERKKRLQAEAEADYYRDQAVEAAQQLAETDTDIPPPVEALEVPEFPKRQVTAEEFQELILIRRDELPKDIDLTQLVQGLSGDEIVQAMDTLRLSPDQSRYSHVLAKELIGAWAKKDPQAVLTYVDDLGTWPLRESAVTGALRELSKTEPMSAVAYLDERRSILSNEQYNKQLMKVMSGFGDTNPMAALNYAATLPNERMWGHNKRRYGFMHVFAEMKVDGTLSQAIPFVNSLPAEGNVRQDAVAALMESWSHTEPAAALEWFGQSGYGAEMDWARTRAVARWANRNPSEAASYVAALPAEDPRRGQMISQVVSNWTQYDYDAPAAWLNEFPPSPQLDSAVANFSYRTMNRDPEGAMSWAVSITNDRSRQRTIERVARVWKDRDPQALAGFLKDSNDLDAMAKHRLLPEVFEAPTELVNVNNINVSSSN
ncbi:MAG: hypothetical protein ACFBZ8_05045 [Opitutales bacterium]